MARARLALAAAAGALTLIAGYEGLRQSPYLDSVGVPTVCYGHTGTVQNRWYPISECEQLLTQDVSKAAAAVNRLVVVPIQQPTFDALVSFTYNVGEGNLSRSTLLRKLNSGDTRGACDELSKWVYAGKQKLRGLERRREAERALCLQGVSDET